MFLLNIIAFLVQKNQVEKHQFLGKKGGCNKTGFFMTLCFAKREKLPFFWGHFLANFGGSSKNTIKLGISALFLKAKKLKNGHFQSHYFGQVKVNILAKLGVPKKGQLGQNIDFENFGARFFI